MSDPYQRYGSLPRRPDDQTRTLMTVQRGELPLRARSERGGVMTRRRFARRAARSHARRRAAAFQRPALMAFPLAAAILVVAVDPLRMTPASAAVSTIPASEDATVDSSAPSTNRGSAASLETD